MSSAMDMSIKIKTEASIIIGAYIFDINLVNHWDWSDGIKYNVNELEIEKRPVHLKENQDFIVESYNINKIKQGYWDQVIEMHGLLNYHSQIIGIHLDLYKDAIAKFERLKIFI